jgi:hypothetical protein
MSCSGSKKAEDAADLEDVVENTNKKGKSNKPAKSADLRAYVIELSTILEKRLEDNDGSLDAKDYQKGTSQLMKIYGIVTSTDSSARKTCSSTATKSTTFL